MGPHMPGIVAFIIAFRICFSFRGLRFNYCFIFLLPSLVVAVGRSPSQALESRAGRLDYIIVLTNEMHDFDRWVGMVWWLTAFPSRIFYTFVVSASSEKCIQNMMISSLVFFRRRLQFYSLFIFRCCCCCSVQWLAQPGPVKIWGTCIAFVHHHWQNQVTSSRTHLDRMQMPRVKKKILLLCWTNVGRANGVIVDTRKFIHRLV